MATYIVRTAVKPRQTPSMWDGNVLTALQAGYTFDSNETQSLLPNPPITGQTGAILWIKLPNGYWLPSIYKGITYVELKPVVPVGKPFTFKVEGYKLFSGTLVPEV